MDPSPLGSQITTPTHALRPRHLTAGICGCAVVGLQELEHRDEGGGKMVGPQHAPMSGRTTVHDLAHRVSHRRSCYDRLDDSVWRGGATSRLATRRSDPPPPRTIGKPGPKPRSGTRAVQIMRMQPELGPISGKLGPDLTRHRRDVWWWANCRICRTWPNSGETPIGPNSARSLSKFAPNRQPCCPVSTESGPML